MGQAAVSRSKTLEAAHQAVTAVDLLRTVVNQITADVGDLKRQVASSRTDHAAVSKVVAKLVVSTDDLRALFDSTNYTARMSAVEKLSHNCDAAIHAHGRRLSGLESQAHGWRFLTFGGRLRWLLFGEVPR